MIKTMEGNWIKLRPGESLHEAYYRIFPGEMTEQETRDRMHQERHGSVNPHGDPPEGWDRHTWPDFALEYRKVKAHFVREHLQRARVGMTQREVDYVNYNN